MDEDVEIAQEKSTTNSSTRSSSTDGAGPSESNEGNEAQPKALVELLTKEAFQKRAMAMLLGGGGAPKASGIGVAFDAPTDGLIILAFEAATWLFIR